MFAFFKYIELFYLKRLKKKLTPQDMIFLRLMFGNLQMTPVDMDCSPVSAYVEIGHQNGSPALNANVS